MARNRARHPVGGMSRREVLGVGAALPLGLAANSAAAATGTMPGMDRVAAADTPTVALEGLETLSAIEMETLEAICERLIPSDEHGPGAGEARVAHYIDRSLGGALASLRSAYASGLSVLNTYARNGKGRSFAELPAAEQDAVLRELEAGTAPGFAPNSAAFFGMLRAHCIEGMFCDPYYGGNANFVGWDLIGYPGLRMAVTPEDQRLVKPAPVRESAYSVGMFGRSRSR